MRRHKKAGSEWTTQRASFEIGSSDIRTVVPFWRTLSSPSLHISRMYGGWCESTDAYDGEVSSLTDKQYRGRRLCEKFVVGRQVAGGIAGDGKQGGEGVMLMIESFT